MALGHWWDSATAAKDAVIEILRQPEARTHDSARLQIRAFLPLECVLVQICVDFAAVCLCLASHFQSGCRGFEPHTAHQLCSLKRVRHKPDRGLQSSVS